MIGNGANHRQVERLREVTERQKQVVRAFLRAGAPTAAGRLLGISASAVNIIINAAVSRMRVQHVTDLRKYVEDKQCQKSVSGLGTGTGSSSRAAT